MRETSVSLWKSVHKYTTNKQQFSLKSGILTTLQEQIYLLQKVLPKQNVEWLSDKYP